MELIDDFDKKYWATGDANDTAGYERFRVCTRKNNGDGSFLYALFNEEGDLRQATIHHAGKRDPLGQVGNVDLKILDDNTTVVGVIVMDECVYTKS